MTKGTKGRKFLLTLGAIVIFVGAAGGAVALVKYTQFGTLVLGENPAPMVTEEAQISAEEQEQINQLNGERESLQKQLDARQKEGAALQQRLSNARSKLEDLDRREAATNSRSEDRLNEVISKLNESLAAENKKLNDSKRLKKFVTDLLNEVSVIRGGVATVLADFRAIESIDTDLAKEAYLLSQQAAQVQMASLYNSSFFKELLLYVFGFKWLWGLFTGYANTTSTSAAESAYADAEQAYNKRAKELGLSLSSAEDRLKLDFESALSRLSNFADELRRYSEELGSRLTKDYLNPFRELLSEHHLRRQQLKLARTSFNSSFASRTDSNLYLTPEAAAALNSDHTALPPQVRDMVSKLSEAKEALGSVDLKLEEIVTGLDDFLTEISTDHLVLRKLNYVIAVSESTIKEINQRITDLKGGRQ